MRIEETTFSLNITLTGETSEEARIQIESLEPMTKDQFWNWLLGAAKARELPKTTRPSREVWRDTRESPQPREVKEKMDRFARQYKRFKRQFPQASDKILREKTKEFLESQEKILSDFSSILSQSLFGHKVQDDQNPNWVETAQD